MKTIEEQLIGMRVHEVLETRAGGYQLEIIRVINGWLYNFINGQVVFVPLTTYSSPNTQYQIASLPVSDQGGRGDQRR